MWEAEFYTHWDGAECVLTICTAGVFTAARVQEWEKELTTISRQIPPETTFRAIVDSRGYEVHKQEPNVHQLQRVVVPTLLARHGFVMGYFRLLEVANTIAVDPALPHCVAVAHVHHDRAKMEGFNVALGSRVERFFTTPEAARRWLLAPEDRSIAG